jgi:amino acid transporter
MQATEARKATGLIRALGIWAATAIVIGGMIGQSVFLVASDMSREVSSVAVVLTIWIVGGFIVLCAACCYSELGAAMPEAGGDYVYLSRGIGPTWGFLNGWTSSMIMKSASQAVITAGLMRFVGFLFPSVTVPQFTRNVWIPFLTQPYQFVFTAAQPMAAGVIIIVTALNYLGIKTVGRFQVILTSLKIAAVVATIAIYSHWMDGQRLQRSPDASHARSFPRCDGGFPHSPGTSIGGL